jgi:hypothetical protein
LLRRHIVVQPSPDSFRPVDMTKPPATVKTATVALKVK